MKQRHLFLYVVKSKLKSWKQAMLQFIFYDFKRLIISEHSRYLKTLDYLLVLDILS